MRIFYPFLIVFIFFTEISQAQTFTRMQSWGLDFESISWIDENRGVIVGERLIAYTEDGGLSWKEVLQEFDFRFNDVILLNENLGIAVGEGGRIFRTSNGGKSWDALQSGTDRDLLSLEKTGEDQLLAVGQDGLILQSTDSGQSWSSLNAGFTTQLNHIAYQENGLGLICGNQGWVAKTQNGGASWEVLSTGITENLNTIEIDPSGRIYTAGEGGTILNSLDTGKTWTKVLSPVAVDFHQLAISPLDQRIVIITGAENTVIRSTNSGQTFSRINIPAQGVGRTIRSVSFKPQQGVAYAVGQDGYSLFSNNSGANWAFQMAGVRNNFKSVDFKNSNFGFVAGEKGQVFVSSNGFTTLINRSLPEQTDLLSMDFWNTGFGYVSSCEGKMYRTSNTGSAWVNVPAQTSESILGFYLFAPSVLYVTGTNGYMARSFDSGVTWDDDIATNTEEDLKDITYFDFQVGFAIGNKGQISWSFGGNVWENLPKLTDEDLNALAKLDSNTAVIVGNKGVFLKSFDKARTWERFPFPQEVDLLSVDFWDTNLGFVSGKNGKTFQTKDGGSTWIEIKSETLRDLNSINYGDPDNIYAVGEDGTILRYSCVPPGDLGEILGSVSTCLGLSTYTIPDSPQAGSEIIWRVDGGEIINGQGTNTIEVNWTLPGRNAVLVSRVNFCGAGETSFLEVQVSEIPSNNIPAVGLGTVCLEEVAKYSVPNQAGVNYTWTVTGGELISGQGTNEIQVRWTSSGLQNLLVIQENFCGKSGELSTLVQVSTKPELPAEIQGEALVGLGEQSYEITTLPGLDYRWRVSGGGRILSGQGTGRIQVAWESEGDFELSVEAQNACDFGPKRVLPVKVNIITGNELNMGPGNLKIYPNPSFNGNITLESGQLDQWTSVEFFTSSGQRIREKSIQKGDTFISADKLPKGLILIQLIGPKGVIQKKVLIL